MENLFPLSFAQQRLLFLEKLQPGTSANNIAYAIRLRGSLVEAHLLTAFRQLIQRHETLRTSFVFEEGQFWQRIQRQAELDYECISVPGPADRWNQALRAATRAADVPFDTANGPLLRVKLYQAGPGDHLLLVVIHHAIAYAWSLRVLHRELSLLYQAGLDGTAPALPALPLQYKDFAARQKQTLRGCQLDKLLTFWKGHLQPAPALTGLPTRKERSAIQGTEGKKLFFDIDPSLREALEALSKQSHVTLYMTLLAAFAILVRRYANLEHVVIGAPVANCNSQDVENVIGLFVNLLPLTLSVPAGKSFAEFLGEVRSTTLAAYMHQDMPFDKLVEEIKPQRSLSYNPVIQVLFSFLDDLLANPRVGDLEAEPLEVDRSVSKFDLELHVKKEGTLLKGHFLYNASLFEADAMRAMAGHFQVLLRDIVSHPKKPIASLDLLTAEEEKQLAQWNQTSAPVAATSMVQLFRRRVRQSPDVPALESWEGQLSYAELDRQSDALAQVLRARGVGPEVIVGLLCTEKSIKLILGILGIWKAGGAYVPLDATYPRERIQLMVQECRISTVLALQPGSPLFGDDVAVIGLDRPGGWNPATDQPLPAPAHPHDLAYVIYTSGSTGKPKGVQLEQGGLANLVEATLPLVKIEPGSRMLQFASMNFDVSVWEITAALAAGATLVVGRRESVRPGPPVVDFLREQAIHHAFFPPSALAVLPERELPDLQTIVVAGEACPRELVTRWAQGRHFFNGYGPTEATVFATFETCTIDQEYPTIGVPLANVRTYVLNQDLQPNPVGIPGELYIGGMGLARGYLGNEALTRERFIFADTLQERVYKTGDLVRYLPDGRLDFMGRLDTQVKIRGFRIEPKEIEFHLNAHPQVKESLVVERRIGPDKLLVGYVIPRAAHDALAPELKTLLREKLPDYMIPGSLLLVDRFPLTTNGKIDVNALPLPSQDAGRTARHSPPQDAGERVIARIWEEALHVQNIGTEDSFFDIGGHSLLLPGIVERLEKAFHTSIPMLTLFKHSTIRALGQFLNNEQQAEPSFEKSQSRAQQRLAALTRRGAH